LFAPSSLSSPLSLLLFLLNSTVDIHSHKEPSHSWHCLLQYFSTRQSAFLHLSTPSHNTYCWTFLSFLPTTVSSCTYFGSGTFYLLHLVLSSVSLLESPINAPYLVSIFQPGVASLPGERESYRGMPVRSTFPGFAFSAGSWCSKTRFLDTAYGPNGGIHVTELLVCTLYLYILLSPPWELQYAKKDFTCFAKFDIFHCSFMFLYPIGPEDQITVPWYCG
jgi:hypothetical protein